MSNWWPLLIVCRRLLYPDSVTKWQNSIITFQFESSNSKGILKAFCFSKAPAQRLMVPIFQCSTKNLTIGNRAGQVVISSLNAKLGRDETIWVPESLGTRCQRIYQTSLTEIILTNVPHWVISSTQMLWGNIEGEETPEKPFTPLQVNVLSYEAGGDIGSRLHSAWYKTSRSRRNTGSSKLNTDRSPASELVISDNLSGLIYCLLNPAQLTFSCHWCLTIGRVNVSCLSRKNNHLRARSDTQLAWLSPDKMTALSMRSLYNWSRMRFLLARYESQASCSNYSEYFRRGVRWVLRD